MQIIAIVVFSFSLLFSQGIVFADPITQQVLPGQAVISVTASPSALNQTLQKVLNDQGINANSQCEKGSDCSYDENNLPDLQIYSVGVFTLDGRELDEQKSGLEIGQTYKTVVYPKSYNNDCSNGVDGETENVETELEYKSSNEDSDGEWMFLKMLYTRPSTLREGDPNKETAYFTVPPEAKNKRVYFRAKVDRNKEVKESDEDNNISYWQKEWYPVTGDVDFVIDQFQLVYGTKTLYQNSIFRLETSVKNIGPDMPLVGMQISYAIKKPNESRFNEVAQDGIDANQLGSGNVQWENTPTDGYSANATGTWECLVCADIENIIPETDEINNCKSFTFDVIQDNRKANIIITDFGLEEGSTIKKGKRVHPFVKFQNNGDACPAGTITIDYLIDGKRRDGDTTPASELCPGMSKHEKVNNDNIKLGDTGNRTITVRIYVAGNLAVEASKGFKVKK